MRTTTHTAGRRQATVHAVGHGVELDLVIDLSDHGYDSAVLGGIPDHTKPGVFSLAYKDVPFGGANARGVHTVGLAALAQGF